MTAHPLRRWVAGVSIVLALDGCSTLEYGAGDAVSVVTDPPGASVNASTGTVCISPCVVVGPRKDSFVITIAKPGFAPQTIVSESKPAGDIAQATRLEPSADVLGRIVDAQDGSLNQHVPAAVVVTLAPVK